jgi:hypothetical protein
MTLSKIRIFRGIRFMPAVHRIIGQNGEDAPFMGASFLFLYTENITLVRGINKTNRPFPPCSY